MSNSQIKDKYGEKISVGDQVYTKYRGGSHEGEVEKIVTSKEEAEDEGVKNPPKVLFTDQHGHRVNHNPGTLEIVDKE
ncbi:hypothetical protein M407DRAFT_81097 [Tulasnella calospora MUT 4182]|uniref:Hypervirulence associated protein TUDOR domain-containing protein n=1 Tax=Tulasnella calospora MUT 4182 TaxID=1051891 RepID=A0A0C3QA23_9AGAM|nr:hypothetical protein M407DRAFT_81097 [Tulasnella calospora MUT 4182]